MKNGMKFDNNKIRVDLIDPDFIINVSKILTFGARKYAPNNWQEVEDPINRYYGAALRHLLAWRQGEKRDPDSGLHHLWHCACNLMFLCWFERKADENCILQKVTSRNFIRD